jgi:hypothetical protein
MPDEPEADEAPEWLARLVFGGLAALLAGLGILAAGLSLGWADPPRAGPLLWQDDFKAGESGWELVASPGAGLIRRGGALVASLDSAVPGTWVVGLAPHQAAPTGDFTLEVAGAAVTSTSPTAYGLVFDWTDAAHFCALLINANGYAQAFRQAGDERDEWYAWQQWPHILVGTDNNRLRVDVRGARVTLRVNDEVVVAVNRPIGTGRLGVAMVAPPAPGPAGEVVFSYARVWSEVNNQTP